MVKVTRELAALERNSCMRPAAVLPSGTAAKDVATPLPMLVERHAVAKSMNPPGAKSAPPMRNESGDTSRSALADSTGDFADGAGAAAGGVLCFAMKPSSIFC